MTRVIMPVNPAGPLGGLGVKAVGPLPAVMACVPSRTREGCARTAGLTVMVPANPT